MSLHFLKLPILMTTQLAGDFVVFFGAVKISLSGVEVYL
jgi:hypothetical protein